MTWKEILERQNAEAIPEVVGDEQPVKEPIDPIAMMRERDREMREARKREFETPAPWRVIRIRDGKQVDDEDES